MHDRLEDDRRILKVTPGNLRQNHVYIASHLDLIPSECIGGSRRANGEGAKIEIELDGLGTTITTDIGADARTGKPRRFIRDRAGIGRFFRHHNVVAGTELELLRLGTHRFRLSIKRPEAQQEAPQRRAAEFFAGIGLVRLGLEGQGWNVTFANDIDPAKLKMYEANFGRDHFHLGDIHKLAADDIPEVELFTASFPCNDLSIAGAMAGLSGKESSAFWGLIRLLREKGERRPPLVMLENVVGFLMSEGGRDFQTALTALNELGYAVDAFILNAKSWVPQSRPRLFVIGKQAESSSAGLPVSVSSVRPKALASFINSHPEIRWDIRSLPELPTREHVLADIVQDLPDSDPHWWDSKRTKYFMGQLSERHLAVAKRMIAADQPSYVTAFRRVRKGRSMAELRYDGIAGCLRTPRGGSGRQILFKAGNGRHQVRLLTARECARLQGVPDDYVIDVPLNQALFGFGDAVCVPAIEWIATNYLNRTRADSSAPLNLFKGGR